MLKRLLIAQIILFIISPYIKGINNPLCKEIIISDSIYLNHLNKSIAFWFANEGLSWEARENKLDSIGEIIRNNFGINSVAYSIILHKKGVIKNYQGREGAVEKFQEAIDYYERALDIRKSVFENNGIALFDDILNGYNNIASNYRNLSNYQKAKTYILKGFEFYDSHSKEQLKTKILITLHSTAARIYMELGDYDNTLMHYESIINHPQSDLLDRLEAMNNSAGLYANLLYDPEAAISILKRVNKIIQNEKSCPIYMIADFHRFMGIAFVRLENYDSSLYHFNESYKYNSEMDSQLYMADDCNNIAVAYNELSKPDSADKYLKKAKDIYNDIGQESNLALVYDNTADALFIKERYKESLNFHNQSLALLIPDFVPENELSYPGQTTGIILDKIRALYILDSKSKTLLHLFKKEKLRKHLVATYHTLSFADQVIGMMRSEFQAEASRMSLASYAKPIYEQGIEACYQLYQLDHQDSILEKAFEFSEKSRAITLLDAVRKTRASTRVDQKFIKDEKSLNLKANYFEKQAALQEQDSSNKTSYNVYDSLLYYRRQRQEVIDQIREATPEYYSLIFDQETTSLDIIQNNLQKDQCLLEYFLGDSSLYTFVIHKDTTFFLKQNDPDSIRSWVSEWVSTMQSLDLSFLKPSHQLYQALIKPAQDFKPLTGQISIVPDGVLNLLNFESLVTDLPAEERIYLPSFEHFVIYQHQLSYAFSATTLYESKPSGKEKQPSFLGIAPELTKGFQLETHWFDQLVYNQEEVLQAASLFSRKNVVEASAAKEQFIQLAPAFSLIHCATHAMANNKDGDLSFILFGDEPNDILYAKDLYALDLNADLVVLSACETSAGELNRGEGIISLARGFIYAGAASVVTSLWNVREKTNKEVIYEFYRLLNKGKAKDEALREAKINYLKSIETETQMNAHPYFWAPLVVIGDPDPLNRSHSWQAITFISLFLIAIVAAIYYYRRYRMNS